MNRRTTTRSSRASYITSDGRPKSKDEAGKGMWSSMLDGVASGRKLPEKNLLVFGGTPEAQKEFFEILNADAPKRPQHRYKDTIVANDFALGYAYQDVLDADHEDILARLSIYMLSEPSPSYAPLVRSLLKPAFIPESLLVILLDWNEPWAWIRQLRDWIALLRGIVESLAEEVQDAMQRTMKDWQERKGGLSSSDNNTGTTSETSVTLPLSKGEWDEPLGLPLCVVCQNADKINTLEIEQNWREEEYDFVLQFLRTILMKHGASLIYTSSSAPNSLSTLIQSSLDIRSTLKKQALKHNVIDRDKVLVPPNWDSWGKIRVLREGFDVEGISSGWSTDISDVSSPPVNDRAGDDDDDARQQDYSAPPSEGPVSPIYESTIADPHASKKAAANKKPGIELSVPDMQTFLASQQEILARLMAEEEKTSSSTTTSTTSNFSTNAASTSTHDRMTDQIGPVQVNMGGIQVDADDLVRKLQNQSKRDVSGTRGEAGDDATPKGKSEGATMSTPDMKAQNEALQSFFSGLVKRGASNSPRGTPTKIAPKDGAK